MLGWVSSSSSEICKNRRIQEFSRHDVSYWVMCYSESLSCHMVKGILFSL